MRTLAQACPLVEHVEQTCAEAPEQYEGKLIDGSVFYFRYRWGLASVGIGPDIAAAVDDSSNHEYPIGAMFDGCWRDEQQRDSVFCFLLRQAVMAYRTAR